VRPVVAGGGFPLFGFAVIVLNFRYSPGAPHFVQKANGTAQRVVRGRRSAVGVFLLILCAAGAWH